MHSVNRHDRPEGTKARPILHWSKALSLTSKLSIFVSARVHIDLRYVADEVPFEIEMARKLR